MKKSVSRRGFLTAATASIVVSRRSGAQAPDAAASTAVPQVSLFATVYDKQGRIVPDLAKEDFELFDKGRKQTISHFSRDTDLPLTLGLLIDTSCSQRLVLDNEKKAAAGLIQKVLHGSKDQAFVVEFDALIHMVQNVTSSRAGLEQALDRVHLRQCTDVALENGGRTTVGLAIRLYEAVYTASQQVMGKRTDQKSIILLTDGTDRGSSATILQAIEQAQRTNTRVYSIWCGGDFILIEGGPRIENLAAPPPAGSPDNKEVLRRISRETGGGYFAVSNKMSLDQICDRIGEELRNPYNLGFIPDKQDRGFHKLVLVVKQKNLTVKTREGYYQAP